MPTIFFKYICATSFCSEKWRNAEGVMFRYKQRTKVKPILIGRRLTITYRFIFGFNRYRWVLDSYTNSILQEVNS